MVPSPRCIISVPVTAAAVYLLGTCKGDRINCETTHNHLFAQAKKRRDRSNAEGETSSPIHKQENAAIDQMQKLIKEGDQWYFHDERYLRAYLENWGSKLGSEQAAVDKYSKVLEWRRENKIDYLREDFADGKFEIPHSVFDFALHGRALNGGAIYYERWGIFEPDKISELDQRNTLM
jgi:hypothetical protein